jgi:hypothetical protein
MCFFCASPSFIHYRNMICSPTHPPDPSSSAEIRQRPNFADIVDILDSMVTGEKDGDVKKKRPKNFVSALIDRHSTWF